MIGLIVFVVAAILLLPIGLGPLALPLEMGLVLLFGWIWFLVQNLPKLSVDWGNTALAAVALAALLFGFHRFMQWFFRNYGRGDSVTTPADAPPRSWRLRWTVAIVALVLTMFVAGISMVGIVHQMAWMARDRKPLLSDGMDAARRNSSSNKLK